MVIARDLLKRVCFETFFSHMNIIVVIIVVMVIIVILIIIVTSIYFLFFKKPFFFTFTLFMRPSWWTLPCESVLGR